MGRGARAFLLGAGVALALSAGGIVGVALTAAPEEETPRGAVDAGTKSDGWRALRGGVEGRVSIPDRRAGVLIQSEGETWRSVRNGPLSVVGAWSLGVVTVLLVLFYAWRGTIRLEGPEAGREVVRFRFLDRFAHWLTATSFIVLALTGLNVLYGRYLLIPVVGKEAFAVLAGTGKVLHNFLAFPFMAGLALMFVLWVRDNLPARSDLRWLAEGGGMFSRRHHPPAGKFNAGQKAVFWVVVLGGASVSLSGLALLFPFSFSLFEGTFRVLNLLGAGLPETLTPTQEMQLAQLWHAAVSLGLVAVILAHVYIGTVGMEGAFRAMGKGTVDAAWARQHHPLWEPDGADGGEERAGAVPSGAPAPGERPHPS